jgi:Meckel syndrome type 1 protein
MAGRLSARSTRFDVALEPAGLGRVDVKVHIGADGAITAALNFDNAYAAESLKARAGELRDALQQAGFDLSGASLSFTSGGAGGSSGSAEGGANGGGWSPPAAVYPAESAEASAQIIASQASAAGGLDIRI